MNIKIYILPLLCCKGILFPDTKWAQTVGGAVSHVYSRIWLNLVCLVQTVKLMHI